MTIEDVTRGATIEIQNTKPINGEQRLISYADIGTTLSMTTSVYPISTSTSNSFTEDYHFIIPFDTQNILLATMNLVIPNPAWALSIPDFAVYSVAVTNAIIGDIEDYKILDTADNVFWKDMYESTVSPSYFIPIDITNYVKSPPLRSAVSNPSYAEPYTQQLNAFGFVSTGTGSVTTTFLPFITIKSIIK